MGEEIKMLTVEQRKRLDELELLADCRGLNSDQDDERRALNEAFAGYSREAMGYFTRAVSHGVDVLEVLRAAISAHGEPTDLRCEARKVLEEIK